MGLNAATFISFTVLNHSYASYSCLKVYDLLTGRLSWLYLLCLEVQIYSTLLKSAASKYKQD